MSHPRHPTRNDWHPDCVLCWDMICLECGHRREDHSHQGQCLSHPLVCPCRTKKGLAAFRDPGPDGR